jgi:glucose dehydrogenase
MPRPVNSCSQVDPGAQNIVTSTDPATGYKTLLLVPLVFSATADRYFRAFDDRSGKVLWRSPRLMEASPDHGESLVSSR